ncbi:hypothetical protein K488DRAFT_46078 [Vararia minispora EC-137]|uniref:Uncharacterized protein n=1 Tax=Vararia minispora EC-137 TaxID=1314806 RepID=A0ACB8QR53_9AGAM|nr:hypothetical protein K488DRAFT_46078 [Vararia minispora EC-137]
MGPDGTRLTKKQKKASAFRDRKGKKKEDVLDVPIAEDQDLAEVGTVEVRGENESAMERVKVQKVVAEVNNPAPAPSVTPSKKRKKEDQEEDATGSVSAGDDAVIKRSRKRAKGGGEGAGEEGSDKAKRFILFIGNLRYTTSREAILEHFSTCDPPPTVRLLTPKQTRPGATVAKSKGCAFLEFSTKVTLQRALKLHHSELDGRKINVELTAGGGGKGEQRLGKLQKRNKDLNIQRSKRLKKAGADSEDVIMRPQRFSTTSGEGEAPRTKRTWTVGNTTTEETHRGGKKAKQRGKKKPKGMGTGVNAIPVG